jgi:hypothetical protein
VPIIATATTAAVGLDPAPGTVLIPGQYSAVALGIAMGLDDWRPLDAALAILPVEPVTTAGSAAPVFGNAGRPKVAPTYAISSVALG